MANPNGYIMSKVKTKAKIPKALREAAWIHYNGKAFESKCFVTWCTTVCTPFSFEVGHNVPESKGGTLDIGNLRPICGKCNRSMAATYTIDEFSALSRLPQLPRLPRLPQQPRLSPVPELEPRPDGLQGIQVHGLVPIKRGFFQTIFACLR